WDALVRDLGAVIEQLELRDPGLVGHSLGAGVALCAAAATPDCAGLVAIDGALPVQTPPPDWARARRAVRKPSIVLARALMRALRVGSAAIACSSSIDIADPTRSARISARASTID